MCNLNPRAGGRLTACGLVAGLCFAGTPALAIDYSDWHTPDEINTLFQQFATDHPGLASWQSIGTTDNGNQIMVLKISDNVSTPEPQEGDVVLIADQHAREWITVETALYTADQLLQRYSSDAQLRAEMNNLQIWILPTVNPDGYAYTASMPVDLAASDFCGQRRFWRKNRKLNGDGSRGIDLNRNWGYQWGLSSGSSSSTVNDTYRGTSAFSEAETSAVSAFIQGLDNLKTFMDIHSYSELFLRPWSYTNDPAPGERTLRALSDRNIHAIASVHGLNYTDSIWYLSSGSSTDYLWGETRTSAFAPELRPESGYVRPGYPSDAASRGCHGFDPVPSLILPNAQENFAAIRALIHDAGAREVWIQDHSGDTGQEPSAVWTGGHWSRAFWVSPDIWTDGDPVRGTTVDLHVRVHNDTGVTQNNVTVDVSYTDPRISLEFPNPDAHTIRVVTGVSVPQGGTTVTVPWNVPAGTNSWGEYHWCVGAVVMSETDLPLTTQAERSSNIAIRNFSPAAAHSGTTVIVAAENFLDVAAELSLYADNSALPPGWHIMLPDFPDRRPGPPATSIERKAKLLGATGPLLDPGETIYIPVRVDVPDSAPPGQMADVNVHAALLPLVAGKREAVGNGFTYRVRKAP